MPDGPFGPKDALRRPLHTPLCTVCEQEGRKEPKLAVARYTTNNWTAFVCEEHDEIVNLGLLGRGWTVDRYDKRGEWWMN